MFNKRVVSVLCVLICQHVVEHIYRMLKERKCIHNHSVCTIIHQNSGRTHDYHICWFCYRDTRQCPFTLNNWVNTTPRIWRIICTYFIYLYSFYSMQNIVIMKYYYPTRLHGCIQTRFKRNSIYRLGKCQSKHALENMF